MPPGRRAPAALAALSATFALTATAQALPACSTPLPTITNVLAGQGTLESVIVDSRGRLFYTDATAGALMRLDAPGAAPVAVAAGISSPGGLAFDADGRHLFVGQGDGLQGGLTGNLAPMASLLRIDVDSGERTTYATGLRMANGVVRAQDGTIYASTDVGLGIDRVRPDATVTNDWATVLSGNGMAINAGQDTLFVNQTFQPAAITSIPIAHPDQPRTFFAATGTDIAAAPDGMTIDRSDRLIVAANLAGEVWRIDTAAHGCLLGRGLSMPSAVTYGHGPTGFSEGRLFAVDFAGNVWEIPGGALEPLPATPPKPRAQAVKVTLTPASAVVRRGRVRLVLHVRRGSTLVSARVRLGGRTVRTGRHLTLRVARSATLLRAAFTLRGRRYTRTIRLLRSAR